MTPEQLARILYTREVEYTGIKATPWEGLHESHRRKWYALAEAALSALRGPRTGEELYEAFGVAAGQELGREFQRPSWTELTEWWRAVHHHVAATFAAPTPPEGWPEEYRPMAVMAQASGFSIGLADRYVAAYGAVATVYGDTEAEAQERARLIAHTLANGAPVQPDAEHGGDVHATLLATQRDRIATLERNLANAKAEVHRLNAEHGPVLRRQRMDIEALLDAAAEMRTELDEARAALRAETNAHIQTKNAFAVARRDEQRAQGRRQRVKSVAMDLAGELADVRLEELKSRIEGADE